jgi:hypothetical protein
MAWLSVLVGACAYGNLFVFLMPDIPRVAVWGIGMMTAAVLLFMLGFIGVTLEEGIVR